MNNLLKNNSTLLLAGGLVIAFMVLGAGFFKSITRGVTGIFTDDSEVENKERALDTFKNSSDVRKALSVRISNLAEELFSAMYGFGTDEALIFKVFDSLKTSAEVQALYVAYGDRATGDTWALLGFKKNNMVTTLREELNDKDFDRIKPKLKLGGLI